MIFDEYTTTSTNIKPETLTLEKFQEIIYLINPKLYYATDINLEKGSIYIIKETDSNPECIIFHPEDFENIKSVTRGRTLVHIKDEPKEDILERLSSKMKKHTGELFKNYYHYYPHSNVWENNNYHEGES